jgi:hypothetical protein
MRRAAARALAGALVATFALVATNVAAAKAPHQMNAAGLALLAKVDAVTLSARVNGVSVRFTLILALDRVVAEQFIGGQGPTATLLVAAGTGATFAREPGSSCWSALPTTSAQSLSDVGKFFPDAPVGSISTPERTAAGWLLNMTTRGATLTYAVGGSDTLSAITLRQGKSSAVTERVAGLRAAPKLLSPSSLC